MHSEPTANSQYAPATSRDAAHERYGQGFRGTIGSIEQLSYLLGRINDELPPAVAAANEARATYLATLQNLIGLLTWQDFELLIDLVFASSGGTPGTLLSVAAESQDRFC